MKKIILGVFIFFAIAILANNFQELRVALIPEKGELSEVILSKYKEDSFDTLFMETREWEFRNTADKEIIDEMLSYLKGLELKEVSERRYPFNYHISFRNKDNYESLWIDVIGKDFIEVRIETVDKEVVEVSELRTETRWNKEVVRKYYEITNGEIDLEIIKDFFNKLEE